MTADAPAVHAPHYDIEHLLGRGAMGAVYAARDKRIGRRVALKTIQLPAGQFEDATAMKEYFQRLQREAEVSGSLQHPNIVTLYDVGYDDERIAFLAMELVEGETLQQILKKSRPEPLPLETALKLTADVLRGLAHAHEQSIVHRDIKPANILVTKDGTAKIADFGIAKPQKSELTAAGSLIGTPNYMSPEQVIGVNVTPLADVFSVGVMLYEALSGVKPFAAKELPVILHKILREEAPHVSDVNTSVPRPVGDFVARLMSKDAAKRPNAVEALAQLDTLVERRPSRPSAAPVVPDMPVPPPAPTRETRVAPQPLGSPARAPRVAPQIPRRIALVAIAGLLIAVAVPSIIIRSRTNSTPTVTIPAAQIAEFESKRRALEEADTLLNAGKFEESRARYEAYLQKYPHSAAAEAGRDRANAALQQAPAEQKQRASRASKKDEDISPRELLDRMKRVFRR